jgi:hypothetical protein
MRLFYSDIRFSLLKERQLGVHFCGRINFRDENESMEQGSGECVSRDIASNLPRNKVGMLTPMKYSRSSNTLLNTMCMIHWL